MTLITAGMGDSVDDAIVLELFVAEGDRVIAEQELLDLSTDKADFAVETPSAGLVVKVFVSEGDTVRRGDPLMEIEDSTADTWSPLRIVPDPMNGQARVSEPEPPLEAA